jgi:hypothetical protein
VTACERPHVDLTADELAAVEYHALSSGTTTAPMVRDAILRMVVEIRHNRERQYAESVGKLIVCLPAALDQWGALGVTEDTRPIFVECLDVLAEVFRSITGGAEPPPVLLALRAKMERG